MKYSNTAITQLTRWYKQILIKCAIFNAAILLGGAFVATPAMAEEYTDVINIQNNTDLTIKDSVNITSKDGHAILVSTNKDDKEYKGSILTINADSVKVDGYKSAIWAQHRTENGPNDDPTKILITADTINLTGHNGGGANSRHSDGYGVVTAMSQGVIELNGNTTITANPDTETYPQINKDAILARGNAIVKINENATDKTTNIDGNIDFNYNNTDSGSTVNALIDVTLAGSESAWTGNTVMSYDSKKNETKMHQNETTIRLKDGATWHVTQVNDVETDTDGGYFYTALNNLDVDNANVNIQTNAKAEIENLVAKNANITGGMMKVTKTIDTIDNVINNYVGKVNLANNVTIKGDVNFMEGTSDTYSADAGSTVTYSIANLIGATGQGTKDIQVVSNGATVNISEGIFDASTGLTAATSGNADGKIKVTGLSGGIDGAADASETVENITYNFSANESVDTNKEFHHIVTVNGDGSSVLTLNADLGTAAGATTTYNNMNFEGTGALNNNGTLHINDSDVAVDVNNYGRLISDPTSYSGTVTNEAGAYASFDADTFESTAELANSGDAYLKNSVTFDAGAKITGNGDLYLMSGTTAFNNTANSNDAYLASGAKFSGALVGGSLDTQNNAIDTGLGTIQNADLYMDAKLSGTGSADAFVGTDGSTIKEITILGNDYNAAKDELKIAVGNATLDDDVVINGANYYTNITKDAEGNLVFSDKLINTSTLRGTGDGSSTFVGDVVIGDKAATTTLGTNNAKVALNNAGKTATVTAANGLIISDGTNNATLKATTAGLDVAEGLTVGGYEALTTNSALNGAKLTDGTVTEAKLASGAVTTAKIAKNAVTTGKIADGAVNSDKLSTGVKNNMLMNATSSDGLTITGGNGSTKANIALKLASTGGLEENATNGLQIKLAQNDANLDISGLSTTNGLAVVAGDNTIVVEQDGVKVGKITVANVADDAVTTSAEVAAILADPTTATDDQLITTKAVFGGINTIFNAKQGWINDEFGYNTATTDANTLLTAAGYADQNGDDNVGFYDALAQLNGADTLAGSVKNSIKTLAASANYSNTTSGLTATTIQGAIDEIDGNVDSVSKIVGPAQTTAATTGQFKDKKIGADINLVDAVDELGRNMVSLGADNVFTGVNTFKNDGGIALQDSAGGNSTRLKATADGLEVDRTIVAKNGVKMGDNTVTSIDTDGTTVTSAASAANVMATSATVYHGAENGLYDGVKVKGDTTATHTIKTAIGATNNALNALTTTAGNEVDSAKVDVQWNSTDSTLATVLGNGDYSSNNYVEDGVSVTTAVGALDTALKTTNDTIGARAIEAGTAGTLAGKTIGTAAGNISVVDALETLNATNVSQNGSLNTLAGLINGQGVDAATGALTGTATALSTGFTATNLVAAANELLTDITVTTDGNYIKADKTAAENLGILDGQIKAYTDKVEVVGAPETAKVADGGLLNNRAITGDTTVDGHITLVQAVRDISATAAGKALNNTFTGNNEFQGTTTFTGATQFNNASNTFGATSGSQVIIDNGGNVQVDKKLTLGGANAISGSENTLDMGKNALTNVAGLTLVNGSADVALNADASGNLVVDNGVIANSFTVGTTGKGFDALGNASTGTLKVGDANAITGTSNALDMNGNDLTNVKDLSVTGKATVGTLAAGATTISAEGATAGTPVSALSVTAENTGDGTSTSFNVTSDGVSVVGQTNLQNTKVQGDLVISDGTNDYTITADSVNAKAYGSTDNYDAYDVLGVSADMFVDGLVATNDGLSVFKDDDGLGNYSEVFGVDNEGSIVSDLIKADNSETGNTITLGKDANTATSVTGTLTADGESKFAKDASDVYSLDVTNSAVTANKEIDANAGVKFGTAADEKVMTSVEQGAVAALNATGNDQKLVSAQSLAATRDAINADTRKVMGSMYDINDDKTVSYKNAALAGTNGFATGAQSLTGALTKFANNVQAAMGTTYAENGTYTNSFAKPDAVDYDGLATNQSLVAAISQLDKNIGTAIVGTDRSSDAFDTSATKTVNENIAALDAAIGGDVENEYNGVATTKSINQNIDAISATLGRMDNLSTEAKKAGSEVVIRGNLTNANNTPLTDDLTVADALSNLDKTLGRIHGLYDGTKVNVTDSAYPSVTGAHSNLAQGTTVENHLVSLDNAIGSRNIASANEDINKAVNGDATAAAGTEARNGSLALGLQTVGDKIGDMDFASTHYIKAGSDLSSSVKTLDSNLYRIEEDVRDLKRDFNRGMASMAAMSALVPNPRAAGNTSLSVGTGAYSGHTAMAIGGFHHINDNVMLNAGAAWGNSRDVAYRLGVTWSW